MFICESLLKSPRVNGFGAVEDGQRAVGDVLAVGLRAREVVGPVAVGDVRRQVTVAAGRFRRVEIHA